MRKVLMALTIVGIALLLPGGSRGAPSVTEISGRANDVPDVTVQNSTPVVVSVPTSSVPVVQLPESGVVIGTQPSPPASSSSAVDAHMDGGASAAVIDGASSTPQPGTCSGMQHVKDSSDNGRWSHTRIQNNNCPDPNSDNANNCDGSSCDN